MFLGMTWNTKLNGWNQSIWAKLGLPTGMKASSIWHQREFMASWMSDAMVAPP
jgi:hypothetical protein